MTRASKAATSMADARDSVIAGALFDFVGYLTSLKHPVTMGSKQNAVPALDALDAWAKLRGIDLDKADVQNWGRIA